MYPSNCKPAPGPWLAFSLDTDEAAAVRRFQEKHGYPPAWVVRGKGLLLVGPVAGDGQYPTRNVGAVSLLQRVETEARPMTVERARQLALESSDGDDH